MNTKKPDLPMPVERVPSVPGGTLNSRLKPYLFPLVSLGLFIAALWAIHHLLAEISYARLVDEVATLSTRQIVLAVLFTAGSFGALMGYDWSALRYIGHRMPGRTVAFASFCGYAFSNTLGLSLLSGGSVRYRVYVSEGLDATDVARITIFNMLAFGIGVHVVGAVALTVQPDLLAGLFGISALHLREIGVFVLAAGAAAVAWTSCRKMPLKIGPWTLRLPSVRIALIQLLVSTADIVCCGACLYILIPHDHLDFPAFMVVYSLAIMAGVASHVPGGLGVFESVMLLALADKLSADALTAGLLMYRVIYYLGPLVLAVALLAIKEFQDRATPARDRVVGRFQTWGVKLVPYLVSVMAFASGLVLMISSATPTVPGRLELIKTILPLPMVEASHLLSSVVGLGLLIVAHGLYRKLNGAYVLALALCLGGSLFSLSKGIDYEEGLILFATAIALWVGRGQFYRHTALLDSPFTSGSLMAIFGAISGMVWITLFSYKHVDYAHDLWWQFEYEADVSRSLRAALGVTVTFFALAVYRLLRPPRQPINQPSAADLSRAEAIIQNQGTTNAHLALMGDKRLLFANNGEAFLMYGVWGASWIALGDPVGSMEAADELAWQFRELADRAGGRIAFYQTRPETLPIYIDMGLTPLKLGEEAIVMLHEFSLEGSARKQLRQLFNRAERDGLEMEVIVKEQVPTYMERLSSISAAWLISKNTREKRFSLGAFDPDYVQRGEVAIIRHQDRIVAFATLMSTGTHQEASIDLMRHLPDAPNSTMEFLFIRLMLHFKSQGFRCFTLGMAPLSGLETHPLAPLWHRFGHLIYNRGERFYNFRGLRQFKDKFDPVWEPRYLVAEGGFSPLLVITDIAAMISGSIKGVISK